MKVPRIMITAPTTGSGKTLVTCGILQALVNRKMNVASFKCGPDYVDPMFHEKVIGTRSSKIDLFFTDTDVAKYLFCRVAENSEISVIEGMMGFYDGLAATSYTASPYDISSKFGMPAILVIDCNASCMTSLPLIKGFVEYRKNNIKGVILNNMHECFYPDMKEMIEKETGVAVLGYLPSVKELVIESRHLGLVTPHEVDRLKEKLNGLADIMERTIDLDSIVRIASEAPEISYDVPDLDSKKIRVRIGVAKDDCFCFIYKDNIELLERFGADIVYFSPLHDERLPEGISGIVIPGGYPELYAETLSRNTSMLNGIKERIGDGMPCMAEGGGFMILHDEMDDSHGKSYRMAGVIDGKAFRTDMLVRFGYFSVTVKNDGVIEKGTAVKGHEFHYWDSTSCGNDCDAARPSGGSGHECIHNTKNLFAGFPQLYYYSNPEFAHIFLKKCGSYQKRR